jgi:hypothetical protein
VSRKKTEHRSGSNFSSRTPSSPAVVFVSASSGLPPPPVDRRDATRDVQGEDDQFFWDERDPAPTARRRAGSTPVANALPRAVAGINARGIAFDVVAFVFQRTIAARDPA